MNSREAAFKILYDVEQNGAYVNRALSDTLRRGGLSSPDTGLFICEAQKNFAERYHDFEARHISNKVFGQNTDFGGGQ